MTKLGASLSKQFALQPSQRPRVWSVIYMPVALSGVTFPAQGLDVPNVATSPSADWKDVICCKFDIIAATAKARVTVMITKGLEFFGGVRAARLGLAGAAAVVLCVVFFLVGLHPPANAICLFIWISLTITAVVLRVLFGVILHPPADALATAHLAIAAPVPFISPAPGAWVSIFGCHLNPQNKTPLQIARSYHATGVAEVLVNKYSLFSFPDNNPSRDKSNYTKNERGKQQ